MSSNTPKLGLFKPGIDDNIDSTADIDNNLDIIDAVVGTHIAASTGVHGITDTSKLEYSTNKGVASGYAPLDNTTKVPLTYLPTITPSGAAGGDLGGTYPNPTVPHMVPDNVDHHVGGVLTFDQPPVFGAGAISQASVNNLVSDLGGKESLSNKGAANGYAPLDVLGKIPSGYISFSSNTSGYAVLNVRDSPFNAQGDGVTDDTLALNAALAAVGDGGIVYLPAGNYIVSGVLSVYGKCVIIGNGLATTITFTSSAAYLTNISNPTSGIVIRDLVLATSGGGLQGIYFNGVGTGTDVGSPPTQIDSNPAFGFMIENVTAQGFTTAAVKITSCKNSTIQYCNLSNNITAGIELDGVAVTSVLIEDDVSLSLISSSTSNIYIANCVINSNGTNGIIANNATWIIVSDNNTSDHSNSNGTGINFVGCQNCIATNNNASFNKLAGVAMNNSNYCSVTENHFQQNFQDVLLVNNARFNEVGDNILIGATDSGIVLQDNNFNNVITTNSIQGCGNNGIVIASGAAHNNITGNNINICADLGVDLRGSYNNVTGNTIDQIGNAAIYGTLASSLDTVATTFNLTGSTGQFPSLVSTTVASTVNPSDTVVHSVSSVGFNSQFIVIGSEVLQVTATNGNNFTVIRGINGTTPGTYTAGAPIRSSYVLWMEGESMLVYNISGTTYTVFRAFNTGGVQTSGTIASTHVAGMRATPSPGYGILLDFCTANHISSNQITNCSGNGIHGWSSSSNFIANNSLASNSMDGIFAWAGTGNYISNNTISDSLISITLINSTSSSYVLSNNQCSGLIVDNGTNTIWSAQISNGAILFQNRNGNFGFNTQDQFGSGVGVIGIANAATRPTTFPVAGGILWVKNGALMFTGANGTETVVAPA